MTVLIEKKGPITSVILNRPEARNAVDQETAVALAEAFQNFEADNSAKVAVFHGAHGTFCAGFDLKSLAQGFDENAAADLAGSEQGPMGPSRMLLSKPVIAAVSGYAVAGGMELALWADLRVMEESAVFGVFCRRWGVPLIDGGTVRLPRLIGHGRALDLILTGRPVGAEEALAMGLANRIVADGTSRKAAEVLAREIAAFPQACMNADRLSAYRQWDKDIDNALQSEAESGEKVLVEESIAGARAFASGAGRHGVFENN